MTVYTAVFMLCALAGQTPDGKMAFECRVDTGKEYEKLHDCLSDTQTRATRYNTDKGPLKVALMPGKVCMPTEKDAA